MKMNKVGMASIALITAALTGCGATGGGVTAPKEELITAECTHKDAPTVAAPLWVCDVPIEGYAISAVGFSEKRPTSSMTTSAATAEARTKMAAEFATSISEGMREYQKFVQTEESEAFMIDQDTIRESVTAATLFGSKVIRTLTSPNQGQYVVVAMDKETFTANAEKLMSGLMDEDARLKKMFEDEKTRERLMGMFISQ